MNTPSQTRPLGALDALTLNAYFFSVNVQTLTLVPILLPILVERYLGVEVKGNALGTLRLVTLMLSLLVHAVAAQLSDRCASKFGRRRPYMLASMVLESLTLLGMGFIISTLQGYVAVVLVFVAIILSMVFSNLGLGPAQGLIPDLVPQSQHGRFSAVKSLFELPLPVIFVSFAIAKFISAEKFWPTIWVLIGVKIVVGLISLFIPERPATKPVQAFDKDSIWRLLGMTLAFTGVIVLMGLGVRFALPALKNVLSDRNLFRLLGGIVGVLAMIICVLAGVAISTRLSLGSKTNGRRQFSWWVINRLAFLVGATNLGGFVLYFLQERFPVLSGHAAAKPTATLMVVIGLSLLVAAVLAGWLTDKVGPKPLLIASGLLAFGASVLVVFSASLIMVYLGAGMIGIASGLFYSANWTLGTQLVPRDEAGRWLGISNIAGAGAGAVGAYIGGSIGDQAGYAVLMAVYGVAFLLSIFALFPIREP